ncbi:MAG: LysM domain-containing protein, partial [Ferruginibacter sp.]
EVSTLASINTSTAVADSKKIHEVQPKEGLYSIAKKYNLSIEEIKQWNQLTSDDLKVGQHLIISK